MFDGLHGFTGKILEINYVWLFKVSGDGRSLNYSK
jgi:hypothetical protein